MLEQKVMEMLDVLAGQLGVASAKIWEWSLLQVRVDIYTTILGVFVTTLIFYLYYRVMKYASKKYDENYSDGWELFRFVFGVVFGIVILVLLISTICDLYALPKLIFNPEYAAFEKILSQLGNLK